MCVQLFYQLYVLMFYIYTFQNNELCELGCDMEQERPSDLFQFMRCMVHYDIPKAHSYLKLTLQLAVMWRQITNKG